MTDRKKPGMAFWATVVVVVMLVYVASVGPACGIMNRPGSPRWVRPAYWTIYAPIIWAYENGPDSIRDAIAWYCHLWF